MEAKERNRRKRVRPSHHSGLTTRPGKTCSKVRRACFSGYDLSVDAAVARSSRWHAADAKSKVMQAATSVLRCGRPSESHLVSYQSIFYLRSIRESLDSPIVWWYSRYTYLCGGGPLCAARLWAMLGWGTTPRGSPFAFSLRFSPFFSSAV